MLKNNLDAYNDSALSFDQKIGALTNYNEAYKYFSLLLREGASVLDTACGPGNISRFINKQVKNLDFTLMDLSEKMLEVAKGYLPDAKIICCDICDFDLKTQFDGIINGFGLPYLSTEDALCHFKVVNKHLKKGGIYYLSFMNINCACYPGEVSYSQNEHPSFNPDCTITVTYHNQEEILKYLQNEGFCLLKKWNLDYKEPDGSITTDVVMILRK